jgi:DNA-binding MarR family transcriptional regulator
MRSLDVKKLEVENPAVARTPSVAAEPDQVDASLEVWARELPDLDLETEGIVERIHKLERHVDTTMRETLDAFDLSYGEYKLMMHLRYGGPPYRGKPGKLAKRLGLSTGAMTNRLDNMERRTLIRRLDDPEDRRGVIVELTDEGKLLWDRAVAAQAEKESVVATALDEAERRQLNELLRRLMNAFERHHGPLVHKDHARAETITS